MKNLTIILSALLVLVLVSCKPEPVVVDPPSANFTYTVDGKTVSFTSTSTGGESYAWDFGDGSTGAGATVDHAYTANGSYIVELTVTNESGSDSKQEVLEIINVVVDGDFSDWESIAVAMTGVGTVTSVKLENLGNNKLFVYVEGTDSLTDLTQIMIDTDNDQTTGALIDWLFVAGGEDILIEGSLPSGADQSGAIFECDPCDGSSPGNWNWGATPVSENIADFIVASEMKSVPGGLAYELSLDLTALGKPINSDGLGIAIIDVSLATWGPVGSAPALLDAVNNPDATMHRYVFN